MRQSVHSEFSDLQKPWPDENPNVPMGNSAFMAPEPESSESGSSESSSNSEEEKNDEVMQIAREVYGNPNQYERNGFVLPGQQAHIQQH